MSFTATIASAVETAFSAVGDLVARGTYYKNPIGDYDPVTDTALGSQTVISNVRMIRTKVTQEDLSAGQTSIVDVKILIPTVDLPGIVPGPEDWLVYQGIYYNVSTISVVPTDALHILLCRKR